LSRKLNAQIEIRDAIPVKGGSINEAYQLITSAGVFFLKKNHAIKFPKMFEKEAEGLQLLKENCSLRIPEVILAAEIGNEALLVMEFIEGKSVDENEDKQLHSALGKGLADLHKSSHEWYGLNHDNFMGSLIQENRFRETMSNFWINNRLKPQIKIAYDGGKFSKNDLQDMERIYEKVDEIIPQEASALIHGDLWSGNIMFSKDGKPCIYDPAISYSHREVDLAMSNMFNALDPAFYDAYNEAFPLEANWKERIDFWNLYPFLIHVNLFGASYLSTCRSIIRAYS